MQQTQAVEQYRVELNEMLLQRRTLEMQHDQQTKDLRETRNRVAAIRKAQEVVQQIAEQVQQTAFGSISEVVNRCLTAVWGEEAYTFRIDVRQKRGKTDAKIVLSRDGVEIDDIAASCGGGVVDVVSFAARMAALQLSRPARRKLLILDEPMKFVSRQYRPAVAAMMLALAEDLGVQIIQVTHTPEFRIGKVIDLGEL